MRVPWQYSVSDKYICSLTLPWTFRAYRIRRDNKFFMIETRIAFPTQEDDKFILFWMAQSLHESKCIILDHIQKWELWHTGDWFGWYGPRKYQLSMHRPKPKWLE